MKKSMKSEKSAQEESTQVETASVQSPASSYLASRIDEESRRISRLWKLYCARVGAADPLHDMRTAKKIFRDELKLAETALEVFEEEIRRRSTPCI